MNTKSANVTSENDEAYQYYPERKSEGKYLPSWAKSLPNFLSFLGDTKRTYDQARCERNVYACTKNSPLVKLLISALESSGCDVDLRRHFACEPCSEGVTGGYDTELNQILICQNKVSREKEVAGVLTHELIHMFDYCRNHADFRNIQHLACSEVRSANLASCSFMSAMIQGDASPFRIRKQHAECVKSTAVQSIITTRPEYSREEAKAIVDKIFDKCYKDLEPIGRRIRRKSPSAELAYQSRSYYGYH